MTDETRRQTLLWCLAVMSLVVLAAWRFWQ